MSEDNQLTQRTHCGLSEKPISAQEFHDWLTNNPGVRGLNLGEAILQFNQLNDYGPAMEAFGAAFREARDVLERTGIWAECDNTDEVHGLIPAIKYLRQMSRSGCSLVAAKTMAEIITSSRYRQKFYALQATLKAEQDLNRQVVNALRMQVEDLERRNSYLQGQIGFDEDTWVSNAEEDN